MQNKLENEYFLRNFDRLYNLTHFFIFLLYFFHDKPTTILNQRTKITVSKICPKKY